MSFLPHGFLVHSDLDAGVVVGVVVIRGPLLPPAAGQIVQLLLGNHSFSKAAEWFFFFSSIHSPDPRRGLSVFDP